MSSLFNRLLDWLGMLVEYGFECLTTATVPAALLAVVVLAVQLFSRRWLRPAQLGLLWGVVVLRLMLPAAPQSLLSLQSLIPRSPAPARGMISVPRADPGDKWIPGPPVDASTLPSGPAEVEEALVVKASLLERMIEWSPLVWCLGFLGILLVMPCRYLIFAIRVSRCGFSSDPRIVNSIDECRARLFMRRNARVAVTDLVCQPAVMGIWHPKLLLPPHAIQRTDAELRMILLHELAHVRQWDIAVNWLLLIVRAVHWPNPVCWLAISRFINLREEARDAMVLRALDGDARHDYSTVLLSLAEQGRPPSRWRVLLPGLLPGLFCGLFQKRALAARLKSIGRAGALKPWWQTAIAIVVLIVAVVTGCTDPLAASTELELSAPDIATQLAVQQGLGRYYWSVGAAHEDLSNDESSESRSYDVTEAVQRIAELHSVHVELATEAIRQTTAGMLSSMPTRRDAEGKTLPAPTVRSWTENERRYIQVNTVPSNHARIAELVPAWESGGLTQICVEVRFIGSPTELGPAQGVNWSSISAVMAASSSPEMEAHNATFVTGSSAIEQRLPVMTTVIDEPTLRGLMRLFQGEARSNIMFSPKVTFFNGQSGNITSQVQRPFVTGVRLVEGRREPQIEICPDGIKIELCPVLTSDRQSTRLAGRAFLSTIIDVKTTSAHLADGPVTIQLPHVERRTIEFQSDLREGESVLVACPPPSDGKRYFYMVLTVRVIDEKNAALFVIPALAADRA